MSAGSRGNVVGMQGLLGGMMGGGMMPSWRPSPSAASPWRSAGLGLLGGFASRPVGGLLGGAGPAYTQQFRIAPPPPRPAPRPAPAPTEMEAKMAMLDDPRLWGINASGGGGQ